MPTVAAEATGTAFSRFNALEHGIPWRHAVPPRKEAGEYRALVAGLADRTPWRIL